MSFTALIDHENQFFHKIGVYLWTNEVLRLSQTCRQIRDIMIDRENAFRLFRSQAGPHTAVKHYQSQVYLHTCLSYDAARIYSSATRNKMHAVSELTLPDRAKIDELVTRLSRATTKLYYIEFIFDLAELHVGDFILSGNSISEPCKVRLQLRRVTRVGLALAADIETTPEIPLVKISAEIESHNFQVRAGARIADGGEKRGFWSDLYPIPADLNPSKVACFVEMKDSW